MTPPPQPPPEGGTLQSLRRTGVGVPSPTPKAAVPALSTDERRNPPVLAVDRRGGATSPNPEGAVPALSTDERRNPPVPAADRRGGAIPPPPKQLSFLFTDERSSSLHGASSKAVTKAGFQVRPDSRAHAEHRFIALLP